MEPPCHPLAATPLPLDVVGVILASIPTRALFTVALCCRAWYVLCWKVRQKALIDARVSADLVRNWISLGAAAAITQLELRSQGGRVPAGKLITPAQLRSLSGLESLRSFSQLSAEALAVLAELPTLTSLSFAGEVPPQSFLPALTTQFSRLVAFSYETARGPKMPVSGLTQLGSLASLRSLTVKGIQEPITTQLDALTNLHTLTLGGGSLRTLSSLAALHNLTSLGALQLSVRGSFPADVLPSALTALRRLTVYTHPGFPVDAFANFTTLHTLVTDHNDFLPALSAMTDLRLLILRNLSGSEIEPEPDISGLAALKQLTQLTLSGARFIPKANYSIIASLPALSHLDLEDPRDLDTLEPLLGLADKLELLSLDGGPRIEPHLAAFIALRTLSLVSYPFSLPLANALAQLPHLRVLEIIRGTVDVGAFKVLAGMHLSECSFSEVYLSARATPAILLEVFAISGLDCFDTNGAIHLEGAAFRKFISELLAAPDKEAVVARLLPKRKHREDHADEGDDMDEEGDEEAEQEEEEEEEDENE